MQSTTPAIYKRWFMCRFCLYKACCRGRIIQVYIIIIHLGKPYAVKRLMVKSFPCARVHMKGKRMSEWDHITQKDGCWNHCRESAKNPQRMSTELKLIEEINNSINFEKINQIFYYLQNSKDYYMTFKSFDFIWKCDFKNWWKVTCIFKRLLFMSECNMEVGIRVWKVDILICVIV